jgi:WD40 repeat protein
MIERVTRDYSIQGTRYAICNEWSNIRDTKAPFRTVAPKLACFGSDTALQLLTNYAGGLLFSPNVLDEGRLGEINTDRFYPTSIDFISPKASVDSKALVAFNSGCFIVFDPRSRSKETNQWYHTNEPLYSRHPPSIARWVSSEATHFVVVFEDNTMWKFSTRYPTEVPRTAEKMLAALKESTSTSPFQVVNPVSAPNNPLSVWRFRGGKLRDLRFVPKTASAELQSTFAICTADGRLLVYDLAREVALVEFRSYFGGFLCLAWSFDGRYIVSGGEDDCVCLWSYAEHELAARGEEHRSWVSSVAFDDGASEVESTLYRFYSAGQDGRLVIWEWPSMTPPQIERHLSGGQRKVQHPPIEETPRVESIASYRVSDEPLSCVVVEKSNVIAGDFSGRIRHWKATS